MSLRAYILRQRCCFFLSGFLLLSVLLAIGQAQVPTTITSDGTLSTKVIRSGNLYDITGGTRPGNGPNLFHSFDRFSVGTNDTARFSPSGPPGIQNILSRVTGGQQSIIDGRLQSTIPGANLYLLNPSGVLFGPNASLDISGSFHVSTADYLRFADGAALSAHLSEKSTLTVAPPAAFGFLGPTPAPIAIQGSALEVHEGQALSVIGGDVQIVGGSLMAPSGRIQLASVASPGEVRFSPLELAPDLQMDSFARLGQLELSQGALLDVSGNGAGTVLIRGGHLLVDSSFIFAATLGNINGTEIGIDIAVEKDFVATNGGFIGTAAMMGGDAGNIRISAGRLEMGNAVISSRALGAGKGGSITIAASETLSISDLGFIFSVTRGRGAAGNVSISTPTLQMDGIATIETPTLGDGHAGDVNIKVERLTLTGGAQIGSTSGVATAAGDVIVGTGEGGSVTVDATESIFIAGRDSTGVMRSGLFSQTGGPGKAGRVTVSTPRLVMEREGQIGTDTGGDGRGGDIQINIEMLSLAGGAQITSSSGIDVGDRLFVGTGQGGTVAVTATDAVIISGQNSGLRSNTRGSGQGGDITLQARDIQLVSGAIISAESSGPGNAGSIRIAARDTFIGQNSAVTTEAIQADGGDIAITAHSMLRLRNSKITATVGGGPQTVGGNITFDPQFVILENSQIRANAFEGQGGNIQLTAGVFLADPASQVSASSTLGINGVVDIRAPVTNLSGVVSPLTPDFARATELLRDRCAARLREGTVSSFVVRGRASLPATYDGPLPSRLYAPQQQSPPAGAGQPPRETTGSPQEQLRMDLSGRVQTLAGAVLPASPLVLEVPCAR